MFWPRLFAGALVALLGACASMPPTPADSETPNFVVPAQMANWSANGKFSFRSPENRESGQFYWEQNEQNFRLRLVGPLGVGTAEVSRTPEGVVIRSRGENYQGDAPDDLLYELTGIRAPLDQLSDILVGKDNQTDLDWSIRYSGVVAVDQYLLPQTITLTFGEMVLKIFISRWII